MRLLCCTLLLILAFLSVSAQRRPLDHSVYDGWESIGERILSPDGKYLVYTITPQQGDGRLIIRNTETGYAKEIPRGAGATITEDSRLVIFQIHPAFSDTRDARIKKKTPDQFPKDTLAWIELGKDSVVKIPRVKSYKVPEKDGTWLAYLLDKPQSDSAKPAADSLARIHKLLSRADSLSRVADSLRSKVAEIGSKGFSVLSVPKKDTHPAGETIEEGTELVLRNLNTGQEKKFPLVSEYSFSKNGQVLIVETTRKNADSASKALVLWVNTGSSASIRMDNSIVQSSASGSALPGSLTLKVDTVMKGFHDAKNYALDEPGSQLAFVAERDSVTRALVKFYRLWYYTPGMDSAIIRADRNSIRLTGSPAPAPLTISPDYANSFSKDGSRLYLGLAPIRPPKDTNLVDFETARLDVWNYKDDYLAPQQLVQLPNDLKRSFLAVISKGGNTLTALADDSCETVIPAQEGNGAYALGLSSKGYRVRQQWEESGLQRLYLVDLRTGSHKLIQDKVREGGSISPSGKFILWYDWRQKNWFTYTIANGKITNITKDIRVPLYDEEDDHPDDPPPHGAMGWLEDDKYVYVYDKYDIWQCNPAGQTRPVNLTNGIGRTHKYAFRYIRLDKEERFLRKGQLALFTIFNHKDMGSGLTLHKVGSRFSLDTARQQTFPVSFPFSGFFKAKNSWTLAYLQGSFDKPYDIYMAPAIDTTAAQQPALVAGTPTASQAAAAPRQLSHINPQQQSYNWFTVELHHWKMFDGKMSEGLLYKPQDFDSTKKYPILFYYYERDAETRYDYMAPQPVRASINIPYFASNGYLVFDPDIFYKTGQPGEDAYNSIMSAVKYLSRFKWVDTTKMALQGHSWGGYQTAYLVTRTHIFAAAEAGAPVANMTSAYGGIRWGTGISRQFQYEKSQSRLGTTLWEHPEVYIRNSPLFRADKVTTPLLMMHNDADGAVPWYQGIEYFSALRRLGKKVWMMQYNGEDHGLGERRNRKDWSIRLGQFFGYYLKGEPPAKWITDGVPATLKGIDWGLETSTGN
ncbi:MAG TPA: prolyl oligopeptidase family serine peptidase [Puia sp.]|nr:prolyl oligopeptidase family serine peptidase [Puia sp.]